MKSKESLGAVPSERLELQRKLSRQVLLISGGFIIIIAILLFINFLRLELYDPLDSTAMDQLISRLAEEPDNDALKNDIRNLDLLARKAYFNSTWQINAGAYLLLFGAILFIAALRFYTDINAKIDEPDTSRGGEVLARLLSRKWILFSGMLVMVLAFAGSYFSRDVIKKYEFASVNTSEKAVESTVELISVNPGMVKADTVLKVDEDKASVNGEGINAIEESKAAETDEPLMEPVQKLIKITPEKVRTMYASFRGPFGQGVSYARNIPSDWDVASGKNIIWKAEVLKPGYSSPVIWGERLFISGGDEAERIVFCYNRLTGKLLWQGSAGGITGSPATPPKTSDDTGLSAPTMAVDDNGVFAIFATGDVIAFSLDGKRLWALNLGVPRNTYGHSSSLLAWDGKLIIQFDSNLGGRMLALSELDGSVIWDIKRDNKASWSSPILIETEGKYEIVTSSDPYVAAYDPGDGHQLWSVQCMMGEVAPSPAYGSGLVFAGNEYATLAAIKPGPGAEIVWEDSEYLPEVSSPVAYDGLLYVATSYGVLVCYDATTGEKQWEHEYGGFYSSPVIADGKLFIIEMSGIMHILKAGREGTVLGEPELGERAFATPAFAEGRIYLRGVRNLYCIGNK